MPDIEIPDHWQWKRLDEIGEWNTGGTPRRSTTEYWDGGTIPWVTPKEMKRSRIGSTEDNMTDIGLEESTAKIVPAGSVLFVTRSGILEHSLPVAIADVDLTVNQDMKTLSTNDLIVPEFILFYAEAYENRILQKCTKDGTTVASVDSDSLYSHEIPVPPIEEQNHIVQKVDEYLTKIESGVRELDSAQQNLRHYKSSLLRLAYSGGLTSTWRNQLEKKLLHPTKTFDGLSEDAIENVSTTPEDTDDLPDDWVWASFGDLFEVSIGSTPSRSNSEYWGGGIPWVSSGEVEFCRITKTEETITKDGLTNSSTSIREAGTVLLGIIGQGKTRGRAAILDIDAAHNQNSAAIEVADTDVPPEFVYYFLMGNYTKTRTMGSGNQQKALNKGKVEKMRFPVPPLQEQKEIVNQLDKHLSIIEGVTKEVEDSLSRAKKLRKSTLQQAMKGTLVPSPEKDTGESLDGLEKQRQPQEQEEGQMTLIESTSEVKNDGE